MPRCHCAIYPFSYIDLFFFGESTNAELIYLFWTHKCYFSDLMSVGPTEFIGLIEDLNVKIVSLFDRVGQLVYMFLI